MASIRTSLGRQEAIRRLITVMQSEYATEISNLQSKPEVDPDLPLPAPGSGDYYEGFVDPEDSIINHEGGGVSIMVTNEGPRSLFSKGSAGPSGHQEERTLQLALNVMFRTYPYPDSLKLTDENGNDVRTFEATEVMRLRAERYVGAMDECVRKYAADGDKIHDIDLRDDNAGLMPIEQDYGPIGIAAALFEIHQRTEAPRMQSLP